jgi:hypothetical protein
MKASATADETAPSRAPLHPPPPSLPPPPPPPPPPCPRPQQQRQIKRPGDDACGTFGCTLPDKHRGLHRIPDLAIGERRLRGATHAIPPAQLLQAAIAARRVAVMGGAAASAAAGAVAGAADDRVVVRVDPGRSDAHDDASWAIGMECTEVSHAHDDASWAIGMECTEVSAVAAAIGLSDMLPGVNAPGVNAPGVNAIGLSDMLPRCAPWAAPSAHHSAPPAHHSASCAHHSALDRSTLASIGASIGASICAWTDSDGAHDGAPSDSRGAHDGAPDHASAAPPPRQPRASTTTGTTSPPGPELVWRCKYECGYESVRANAMGASPPRACKCSPRRPLHFPTGTRACVRTRWAAIHGTVRGARRSSRRA